MTTFEVPSSILSSPFEEPKAHWWILEDQPAATPGAPFPAGEHGQVAVKVIDPRGNELLVVKKLEETK